MLAHSNAETRHGKSQSTCNECNEYAWKPVNISKIYRNLETSFLVSRPPRTDGWPHCDQSVSIVDVLQFITARASALQALY